MTCLLFEWIVDCIVLQSWELQASLISRNFKVESEVVCIIVKMLLSLMRNCAKIRSHVCSCVREFNLETAFLWSAISYIVYRWAIISRRFRIQPPCLTIIWPVPRQATSSAAPPPMMQPPHPPPVSSSQTTPRAIKFDTHPPPPPQDPCSIRIAFSRTTLVPPPPPPSSIRRLRLRRIGGRACSFVPVLGTFCSPRVKCRCSDAAHGLWWRNYWRRSVWDTGRANSSSSEVQHDRLLGKQTLDAGISIPMPIGWSLSYHHSVQWRCQRTPWQPQQG